MALDPTLELRRLRPDQAHRLRAEDLTAIATLIHSLPGKVLSIRIADGSLQTLDKLVVPLRADVCRSLARLLGDRWIVFGPDRQAAFGPAVLRLLDQGGNGYQTFEQAHFHLISPGKYGELVGGSCSSLTLACTKEEPIIRKVSRSSPYTVALRPFNERSLIRREGAYLRKLSHIAPHLFPPVINSLNDEAGCGYVTPFLRGYTFSERLFHGTLTAGSAVEILTQLFVDLCRDVYSRKRSRLGSTLIQLCLSRVLARRAALDRLPHAVGRVLRMAFSAPHLAINGVHCPGFNSMMASLTDPAVWEPHLASAGGEFSHGDLVLDNIVVLRDHRTPVLIDPNPSTGSRLYDVAKLLLSLTSYFEFFQYDRFSCSTDFSSGRCSVWISLADNQTRELYNEIALQVPTILEQAGILARGGARVSGIGLMLLNGLQNLAVPLHHLVYHGAEKRALAFFSLGMLRLTQVQKLMKSGVSPPLRDAIPAMVDVI